MASFADSAKLVGDIKNLCRRRDRSGPENILLIGKSGAGKSAIINTLIRAVSGEYFDRAKVGAGEAQSKTLQLVRYKNCGVMDEDLSMTSAVNLKELRMLSNVYDVPGLGDSLGDDIKEIIRLLITGRIPDRTGIAELQKLQRKHGVGNLDAVFDNVDPKSKINKIVFVQSATDTVPEQLIKGLHEVLGETDPETCRLIYDGDIFLLITHYDMVSDEPRNVETVFDRQADVYPSSEESRYEAEDGLSSDNPDKYITRSSFIKKEKLLARLFHIEGMLGRNRLYWTSMCDATGYDDPDICTNALKFLKFMMSPSVPEASSPPKTVVTAAAQRRLQWRQMKQGLDGEINMPPKYIFWGIVLIIFAVSFLSLLAKPP